MYEATIGWGVIGASSFADEVMVAALNRPGRSNVVALHSTSAKRLSEFAEKHQIPERHKCLDELLADPKVNATYVSTTNDRHAAQVCAAARAGKHVLCEKPMATNMPDARRMRDECTDAGVILAVNHHVRCQDTVRAMRTMIKAGTIGTVLAARVAFLECLVEHRRTWRTDRPETGAGVILDLSVHDVDTLRYLLDDEIVAVTAMATTQGVALPPTEDGVVGVFRTRRGVLISFHDAFTVGHAGSALEVYGTTGSLIGRDLLGATPAGEVILRRGQHTETIALTNRADPYVRTVDAMLDAILHGDKPLATADDGLMALAVALAVRDSAASQHTIVPALR
jgi:1,5-anhydro-D-fructose reductase (1,5-anhydro-D-mannitol-forming)